MNISVNLSRAVFLAAGLSSAPFISAIAQVQPQKTGSVIFFHPDGTGLNHWNALRAVEVGPDGELHWDRLPAMAVYKGHMSDALTGTSHGGATVHAYGVKVQADSFGMDGSKSIKAASGKYMSILHEAKAAGKAIGLVQTGHIAEPGTAAFAASVQSRRATCEIAKQVIGSGADVILAGGEKFLLPIGVAGRHGKGACVDNLIEAASRSGYTVVYNRDELAALAAKNFEGVGKLLGAFAHDNTYNDQPEEKNRAEGLSHYDANAPTVKEMSAAALAILSRSQNGFLLITEEEGTDNMANENNAPGQLEALRRADEAVGLFHGYVKENPDTLLLMAADSEAGGMTTISYYHLSPTEALPEKDPNGAPYDGNDGAGTKPFSSAPDSTGRRLPFGIAWATKYDTSGAILVRGAGLNSDLIRGTMDSTEMYRLMYLTLFGIDVRPAK